MCATAVLFHPSLILQARMEITRVEPLMKLNFNGMLRVSVSHDAQYYEIFQNDIQHNDTQHKGLFVTCSINDTSINELSTNNITQHNCILPYCKVSLCRMSHFIYYNSEWCYIKCHNVKCLSSECHGAVSLCWMS